MKIDYLLDDPYKFFRRKKPQLGKTIVYAIALCAIFAVLNGASIYFHLTPAKLVYGNIQTTLIIFSSLVVGFLLVALPFALIATRRINSKTYKQSLFVISYSSTPFMLFGWIPHAAVKIALLAWTFAFVAVGVHIVMKKEYKEALIVTAALLVLIAAMSIVSQNYILAPV